MGKWLALFLAGLALTGCASFTPMDRPAFPVAEYESLAKSGTGIVTGQVFLRTMVGEVRYGAGSEVMLNPVTSYSRFWYENGYLAKRAMGDADARQDAYIITTQADGSGNFRFDNVPAGDYYLTSSVFWQVPLGQFSSTQQGGWISEKISISDGEEVRKMLTK